MTAMPTRNEPEPCGRFEWERIVRRLELPMRIKYTAIVLATYADADGSQVRPGVETLAAVTSQGASTVRRQVSALLEYGLLVQVSRGGGRAGRGRATEYQLTVPVDLLERVPMLPVAERKLSAVPDSPLAQESAHSEDDSETPLPQASAQSHPHPVDNPPSPVGNGETPLAIESAETAERPAIERSENAVTSRLSARFERLSARSSELLPKDQPPKAPTTTPDPTQPPTARDRASPRTDRCPVCRQPHAFLDPCRPTGGDP